MLNRVISLLYNDNNDTVRGNHESEKYKTFIKHIDNKHQKNNNYKSETHSYEKKDNKCPKNMYDDTQNIYL